MTLSDRSTEGKMYHLFYWISAQPSIPSTMIAWRPSSGTASLLLVSRYPGSSRICLVGRILLCLKMIEAVLLLFVVVYRRALYLAWSSSSHTLKMLWNFSIGTVWVIIFLLTIHWCSSQWTSALSPPSLALRPWPARMVRVAQAPTQCLQDGASLVRLSVLSQSTKTGRSYSGNRCDRRETDWRCPRPQRPAW